MAANWKNTQGIASLGKRFVNQIWTPSPPPPPASSLLAAHSLRRCAHASAYDKNLEEGARPSVVPDHMIQPESDKYWAPHPQTGVFGPVSGQEQVVASAAEGGNQNSALEEKAWFRPTSLEDLEKPHHV